MDWLIAIVGIGCASGVLITFIEKAFGGRQKALQHELRVEKDRVRMLETQLAESHRQSDQLQKQLEWHTKMLETQDRLMKQLTDGTTSERAAVSRT